MAEKWRLKKGDKVRVIAGKDRGVEGEILKVIRDERRVIVAGVNVCTRHRKPSAQSAGGIEKKEASIHVSNVMLIDPSTGNTTRVGFRFEDGKKVRFAKRSGAVID